MTVVPLRMWMVFLREFTIWYVVKLSKPVEISSMNNASAGPTSISPLIQTFHIIQLHTHTHTHTHTQIYIYIYIYVTEKTRIDNKKNKNILIYVVNLRQENPRTKEKNNPLCQKLIQNGRVSSSYYIKSLKTYTPSHIYIWKRKINKARKKSIIFFSPYISHRRF